MNAAIKRLCSLTALYYDLAPDYLAVVFGRAPGEAVAWCVRVVSSEGVEDQYTVVDQRSTESFDHAVRQLDERLTGLLRARARQINALLETKG